MPTTVPDRVRSPRQHLRLVRSCEACSLSACRTAPVVGDGPAPADLLVLAPAPGRHEDLVGKALAGSARNVLDAALLDARIDPESVRVTTLVRCRAEDGAPPTMAQIRACTAHLDAEFAMVQPSVVLALGALPTSVLLGHPVPFDKVRGYRLDVRGGITLVPTHQPHDAVRGDHTVAEAIRRDVSVAAAVLAGRMKSGADARDELRARLG
ncbi:MAG: uracil-DNA glycosylase [Nitriliruptoraceae bacterium]|nr:uracil-DNA glycosylase [Nitriliruptoraceae bacterium]